MYRINRQISIAEFLSPFGELNKNNRWVRIADMIPWERFEEQYAAQFCENNGTPAIQFRMALGTLIIKQRTGLSDAETWQYIAENPYKQYLIGLHEFVEELPFTVRSITNFRKYITKDMIDEINRYLFSPDKSDDNKGTKPGGGNVGTETDGGQTPKNKGSLLLDATCVPAGIAYPTDVNLLNEAREKTERMIDDLHPYTGAQVKPRTYRQEAKRRYLTFVKKRKPGKKTIRKAAGQQLRYVKRNLKHIGNQLMRAPIEALSDRQREQLKTIRTLHFQQDKMYQARNHSVNERIVSIGQPHVRPIVTGKAKQSTEFGAKVSVSMVDGYAFVEKLDWEAYSEAGQLQPAVEGYKMKYGHYPEAVMADKLFRNRENLGYCKKHGIRLSGPRLGRPPKHIDPGVKIQERNDVRLRNAI